MTLKIWSKMWTIFPISVLTFALTPIILLPKMIVLLKWKYPN